MAQNDSPLSFDCGIPAAQLDKYAGLTFNERVALGLASELSRQEQSTRYVSFEPTRPSDLPNPDWDPKLYHPC
jgi:hypothetical protein